MRLEVPLMHIPPKESEIGSNSSLALLDADRGAVSVSVQVEVGDLIATDGRDAGLPPSAQSAASPMHLPDGPTGLPKAKKRRVMFAE